MDPKTILKFQNAGTKKKNFQGKERTFLERHQILNSHMDHRRQLFSFYVEKKIVVNLKFYIQYYIKYEGEIKIIVNTQNVLH